MLSTYLGVWTMAMLKHKRQQVHKVSVCVTLWLFSDIITLLSTLWFICGQLCMCVSSYYNKETTNIVSLTKEDFIFNTF